MAIQGDRLWYNGVPVVINSELQIYYDYEISYDHDILFIKYLLLETFDSTSFGASVFKRYIVQIEGRYKA